MNKEQIIKLHRDIVNSIDYDDLSYNENQGEWVTSISVMFKAASRYTESFKGANPFSIIESWTSKVYDYLIINKPISIKLNGNIITAVFNTSRKSDIESVIYHAAYICSLMDLFNFILDRKGIRNFDIGIGVYTAKTRKTNNQNIKMDMFFRSPDLKSILLSINANIDGVERILISDCTQFNISEFSCYDDKKYSEVGVKRTLSLPQEDAYGYNLNLIDFSNWIDEQNKKNNNQE